MLLSTKYKLKEFDEDFAKVLQKRFKISKFLSLLLSQRVKDTNQAKYFFSNNLQTLHSPFYFSFMKNCVERLHKAIENREKVYIFGDKDTDGITSITLIRNYLTSKGLEIFVYAPTSGDYYGFNNKNYDAAKKCGATLTIAVDTGVTLCDEVEYGKRLGIETIILDHHKCKEKTPECIIINPKCDSSGYPFYELSAAAVVSKVIWASEFAYTQEYNATRILLSLSSESGGYRVFVSRVVNFIEEEKKAFFFRNEKEFLKSQIYTELSKYEEIYVYKKYQFFQRLSNICELYRHFYVYIPSLQSGGLEGYYKKNLLFDDIQDAFLFLYKTYILRKNKNISSQYLEILDLVCISTIADMMAIVDENRVLVSLGLTELNKRNRINLQGILSQNSLVGVELSARDVAFSIAPVINSAGRLGRTEVATNVFIQEDLNLIDIYSRELLSLNAERQNLKNNLYDLLKDVAEESYRKSNGRIVFVANDNIPEGIAGLLASAFSNNYKVSSVVLSVKEDMVVGSIRTKGDIDAIDVLNASKGLLDEYGGHKQAAGFRFKSKENIKKIKENCIFYLKNAENYSESAEVEVDAKLSFDDLDYSFISDWEKLSPFGVLSPNPIFLIEGLFVKNIFKFLGKNKTHLSLNLEARNLCINAVMWDGGELFEILSTAGKVNVLCRLEISYFKTNKEYRLVIMDIEKT